jgi:hypothetical protein
LLIFGGAALVAAFSNNESDPYWALIPALRTDTSGFLAFAVALVSLPVSRYLELRRRGDRGDTPVRPVSRSARVHAVQAVAEAALVLGTGLVIYLSLNAVTHPSTLEVQLTHLASRPSEGTVRVFGLFVCLAAVATRHYLRATATRPADVVPPAENPRPRTEQDHFPRTEHDHFPGAEGDRLAVSPGWPTPTRPISEPWPGAPGSGPSSTAAR